MLEIDRLVAGYGNKQVLFDVCIKIDRHQIASIVGPNGAGKSTILRAIYGLVDTWSGDIFFEGRNITCMTAQEKVSIGIAFTPQGRKVFDDLSVFENLTIGALHLLTEAVNEGVGSILEFFPALRHRMDQPAGSLSGGEQQMVALGRAMLARPKVLLLDEPSHGLAPNVADMMFEKLIQINSEMGITMVVVEHKVRKMLDISHKVFAIKLGRNAFSGHPKELLENPSILKGIFL